METKGSSRERHAESSFDESKEGTSYDLRSKAHPYSGFGNSEQSMLLFWIAVGLSQAVGIIVVALVVYYCVLEGGFAWTSDANKQFFYHPFLMVLGLVFFYGDAILIYRVLYFLPKWILKLIHAILHVSAIAMSSVGLAAVFENHRRLNRADLYSLHSWVGLGTFAFFCLQYVGSFIAFLFPGLPPTYRAKMMPFHTFFGLALFLCAVASAEMGLAERLAWNSAYTSGKFPEAGVVANCLGLFMIIFACLVVFITTHSQYKRKPLPSDTVAPVS